ncbi:hypothetical protein PMM47T1_13575 [Pseudomonas sp. M47T1]|uniref:CS1 type fimbrial major subunit n=1 Tax=unclassified Pseudomonas TaxID=196821 RepID=UPI00026082F9|nr:CS1 type fimbrial major subunit [Pseudomonas sp. M47T1]EIK95993.1 hypothetical protein PMM47T1_13575 [Pseudomonas sp. M47T1]
MKKLFLALPLALLFAGNAMAVDPIEKQVTVTAQIPTDNFFVEPVGGNWMNDPQEMAWNSFQETLQPISKQLQVKSTTGAISAYLLTPAVMTSGANNIALNVSVAGKSLTTTAAEVVSASQAAPGATVGFQVAAVGNGATFVPGNYQGVVNMMFETVTPTGP